MHARLTQTLAVSHRASRRGAAAAFIARSGHWLTVGTALGIAGVGVWKLMPDMQGLLPWWALLGTPLALASIGALAVTMAQRWPSLRAARELDDRLGLGDRLSSALELTAASGHDPFVVLAVRDAEHLSASVDVRRAVPFRWSKEWAIWPALAAAGIAVGVFVPSRTVGAGSPDRPAMRAAAESTIKQINAVSSGLRQAAADRALDSRTTRDLDDFSQLEQELADGHTSPDDARAQAARRLEEIASQVEKSAQSSQADSDRARQALAQSAQAAHAASPQASPSPGDGSDFRRALREGDLGSAASAARELAQQAESMPAEQREAIARDLSEIVRQLEAKQETAPKADATGESPQSPDTGTTEPDTKAADPDSHGEVAPPATSNPGSADKPAQADPAQPTPDKPAAQPEQKPQTRDNPADKPPLDPDVARKAAESQPPRQPEQKDPASENPLERLSQALRQAAKEMSRPAEPRKGESAQKPSDSSKPRDQTPSDNKQQPGAGQEKVQPREQQDPKGTSPNTPQPGLQQRPSDKPSPKQDQPSADPEPDAGHRPTPSQDGPKSNQPSPQPNPTGRPEPGAKKAAPDNSATPNSGQDGSKTDPAQAKPGAQDQSKPGDQADGKSDPVQKPDLKQQSSAGKDSAGQNSDKDPSQKQDQKQGPGQGQAPNQSDDPKSSDQPKPGAGARPEPDKQGSPSLERLARELERLKDSGAGARENQESAKRLREQARKLLENASPEDLRKLSELARRNNIGTQPGSEPGMNGARDSAPAWDGGTRVVDARGTPQPATDGQDHVISELSGPPERSAPREGGQVSGQAVRQAAQGAQRAVEQQAVPPQYGPFVKRVFKRFSDRAGPEKPAPQAPTPDAPDATRKQQ